MMILNVTVDEFRFIKSIEERDAANGTDDLASFCHEQFGCEYFESYEVVVRRDVPSVPWIIAGVERITARGKETK